MVKADLNRGMRGDDMAVIALSGPNAIGKTTSVCRWAKKYSNLLAALADSQREALGVDLDRVLASRPNTHGWKGTEGQKCNLVESHRKSGRVVVIESMWTTCAKYFLPGEHVILVVTSGEVLEKMLRARTSRRGRVWKEDFWTDRRLEYTARNQYLRFRDKHPELEVRVFEVFEYGDWGVVDEYFGKVYRKLNNAMNRVTPCNLC